MATLTQLLDAIAVTEGMDLATVRLIARYIREVGHIATGGRGLSAAKMSPRDAANLLIAVNTTSLIREASSNVITYRELVGVADQRGTRFSGTFGEGLETLIESACSHKLPDKFFSWNVSVDAQAEFANRKGIITVTFERPVPIASLTISDFIFGFWEHRSKKKAPPNVDRRDTTSIGSKTIFTVADILSA